MISFVRAALECVVCGARWTGRNALATPPPHGLPIGEQRLFRGARGVPTVEKQTIRLKQNSPFTSNRIRESIFVNRNAP